MRCVSSYGLKETIAAVVLSSFIAGGVGAMTSPGVADNAQGTTSVNRTLKGDRLPLAPIAQQSRHNSPAAGMAPATRTRAPLGCDPAFSPVADPARGHIFKRCMA
jgi:hypothetical protein